MADNEEPTPSHEGRHYTFLYILHMKMSLYAALETLFWH